MGKVKLQKPDGVPQSHWDCMYESRGAITGYIWWKNIDGLFVFGGGKATEKGASNKLVVGRYTCIGDIIEYIRESLGGPDQKRYGRYKVFTSVVDLKDEIIRMQEKMGMNMLPDKKLKEGILKKTSELEIKEESEDYKLFVSDSSNEIFINGGAVPYRFYKNGFLLTKTDKIKKDYDSEYCRMLILDGDVQDIIGFFNSIASKSSIDKIYIDE